MKAVTICRVFLSSALALIALPGHGQDLTVFQGVEGGGGGRGQFQQMPMASPAAAPAQNTQNLTLKGIYRFGDTYHVSLVDQESGGNYRASWQEGQSANVTVAGGYEIQSVDSRTVNVNLPNGIDCEQNPIAGSNCLGRAQVALSFAVTEPVRSSRNFTFSRDDNGRRGRGNDNDDVNPFSGIASEIQDARGMIEAAIANGQDPREAIRDLIGNRGRGGDDRNDGGRGGRGGGGGRGGFGGFPN